MKVHFLRNTLFLGLITLIFMACEPKVRTWELNSPDEKLALVLTHTKLDQDNKTELTYQVFLETEDGPLEMIKPSLMGISRTDGNFTNKLRFESETEINEFGDSYELISSKKRHIEYSGNELTVTFKNDSNQIIDSMSK